MIVQIMFGEMNIDNEARPDYRREFLTFFLFGAAVQKPYGGTMLKYGPGNRRIVQLGKRCTVLLHIQRRWRKHGKKYHWISILFSLTIFFGGYASFEPAGWVRLYLGSGPP